MKKHNRHKRRIVEYFLYKEKPFRPLYMHGLGFRVPPSRLEKSLSAEGYYIWLFRSRELARSMCAANNRPNSPCSYANYDDYHRLANGQIIHQPTITRKPSSLESLA